MASGIIFGEVNIPTKIIAYNGKTTNTATTIVDNEEKTISVDVNLDTVQEKLVAGENIKTINDESILGEGNITISSGTKLYRHYLHFNMEDDEWECSIINTTPVSILNQSKTNLISYIDLWYETPEIKSTCLGILDSYGGFILKSIQPAGNKITAWPIYDKTITSYDINLENLISIEETVTEL